MKIGDFVIVAGESNEVFTVTALKGNSVVLNTGWVEPIHKCIRIPKELESSIHTITTRHINYEVMETILEGN